MKTKPKEIAYVTAIRKDGAIRIPIKVKKLGYTHGIIVQVTLEILFDKEQNLEVD